MKRWTISWLMLGIGAALVFAALVWVTFMVLRLERTEREARLSSSRQEVIRLALWRMDSWLSPRLATESSRPYFEYLAFYPQDRAYTRVLNRIEKGEVLTPSPLLTFRSPLFPLHVQLHEDGRVTSPQVPEGNERDLAESAYLEPGESEAKRQLLADFTPLLQPARLTAAMSCTETLTQAVESDSTVAASPAPHVPRTAPPEPEAAQSAAQAQIEDLIQSKIEWSRRAETSNYDAQSAQIFVQSRDTSEDVDSTPVNVGALTAVWLGGEQPLLMWVRRVEVNGERFMQGVVVDWSGMQRELLAQVSDLLPEATLHPVRSAAEAQKSASRMLAGIPGSIEPGPVAFAEALPASSPVWLTLLAMWASAIVAVAAGALTVRASLSYADKRSRFASTVTHELRTPLTTFQLYSEMLAEDMVRDPEQRQKYLRTLQDESQRLGTLVENVLSYARIEQDRFTPDRRSTTPAALLQAITARARQRAGQAGMQLCVNAPDGDVALRVDTEALGQIIFNLADNAAKYAGTASDRRIHLDGRLEGDQLVLTVRDHGPGVPRSMQRHLFKAFERGVITSGGDQPAPPGIGLGLALCRELATEMGGSLEYADAPDGGAMFTLTVPTR